MAKRLTFPHEPDGRLFQTLETTLVGGFLPRFVVGKNRAIPHCGMGKFFGPVFPVLSPRIAPDSARHGQKNMQYLPETPFKLSVGSPKNDIKTGQTFLAVPRCGTARFLLCWFRRTWRTEPYGRSRLRTRYGGPRRSTSGSQRRARKTVRAALRRATYPAPHR